LDKIELTEKQDARVHYPVLTQHPHTTKQTTTTAACPQHAATCTTGTTTSVSSQTPNSAPTTNQHQRKAQTLKVITRTRRPPLQ
ncbi:hypothetical protein ACOJAD_11075, partial [Corynebacterium amycolatum]|uniref:hypothetical protein n=1 Tax=Corynebacterium amycolatum TaxID=43765 RepID=UPI003B5B3041